MKQIMPFQPGPFFRNRAVQTYLASAGIRTLGKNIMNETAREVVIDTTDGIRLLGYHSKQKKKQKKGLVVLIHGWEGSFRSTYIQTTGRSLYSNGFDVFRLNLRDHGPSHHLNQGIFYAVLLDEVFDAVKRIADLADSGPMFLAGFSLGGNFALRIARQCSTYPIKNLAHVMAISPVLDPGKATERIDATPLIRQYFLKKWRRSLKIKQNLFPDLYNFTDISSVSSIGKMTDLLLERYSDYSSTKDYFNDYAVRKGALEHLSVPSTIITSKDDPIIPVEDFHDLRLNGTTNLIIWPYGGHNGFLEGLRMKGWYENLMVQLFSGC